MAISPFRKVVPKSDEVRDLQNAVSKVFLELLQVPFLNGRLIKDVTVTSSGFDLEHGLGRAWTGWFMTKRNNSAEVWDQSTQPDKTKFIRLDATSSTTFDIWVF